MIAASQAVRETVTPAVAQSEVTSSTYPYLLATVTAPASPLGDFVYELEIDHGAGWQPATELRAGPVHLRSGQSRRIPVYGLSRQTRYRLRTHAWEASEAQLRGRQSSELLPLLSCSVPGVRQGALMALHQL